MSEKLEASSTLEVSEGFTADDTVRRVHESNGSHIEPPLDQDWPDLDKLQWRVAVAKADSGLQLRVHASDAQPARFALFGASSGGSRYYTYAHAWEQINGWQTGAEHLRAQLRIDCIECGEYLDAPLWPASDAFISGLCQVCLNGPPLAGGLGGVRP